MAASDLITEAQQRAERNPGSVTLVAVSKTKPARLIEEAIVAGHRVFGENRVQEAQEKWPELKRKYPDIHLHLIGPLQTNKAREAVALFDVIETLDRPKLAQVLSKEMQAQGRNLPVFIQVNTGLESQKAGIIPKNADDFISECRALGLNVSGLMCIPPKDVEPAPHFALLRQIALRNGIENLSMGMSADYLIAIQIGATHVRVGSAIFGGRG